MHVQVKNSKTQSQTCHENMSLKRVLLFRVDLLLSKIHNKHCSRTGN